MNRHFDESRRVVRNRVRKPFRKTLRELISRPLDGAGDLQRVGARLQKNTDQRRLLAVYAADEVVVLAAKLDPCDVSQTHCRCVAIGADDDVFELLRIRQPPLRSHCEDELLIAAIGRLADFACGKLCVLFVDRADHIGGRQLQLSQPVRPHPDAHRIVFGAEDLHIGRAGQPLQLVQHIQRHIIRRKQIVEPIVGRIESQHLQERRRAFFDRYTLAPYFLRQTRFGLLDAVVDVQRRLIGVGADLERHLNFHNAVG